jgi:DNA segregation ATPase FtsK/SpoIIIE, S-DNA-T family
MSAYVLGFTRAELAAAGRWGVRSLVFGYAGLLRFLGRGAVGAVRGVSSGQAWMAERRAARAEMRETMPSGALRAEPPVAAGLLGRAKSLMARREPVPELLMYDDTGLEPEDRIRSRIADAVRAKVGERPAPVVNRAEPPVVRRTAMPEPEPVDLYDEDDFGSYTLPEHELVEGRPHVAAPPMFESARSPEAEARRVQHAPRKAPQPTRRRGPRRSPRFSTRRPNTRRRRSTS